MMLMFHAFLKIVLKAEMGKNDGRVDAMRI
jgi:hypothetical protein